jgi:hypothetical protein
VGNGLVDEFSTATTSAKEASFLVRLGLAGRQLWRWAGRPVVTLIALIGTAGPSNGLWAHLYPVVLGIPLVVTAVQRRSGDAFRLWSSYILGFLAFRVVRNFAEGDGSRVHYGYVIAIDRAIGLGQVPTVTLQNLWFHPDHVSVFDWYLIGTYLTYFAFPPLLALVLWATGSGLFRRYVMASLVLFAASAVIHIAIPTAPPWLASYRGLLPPVHRIANEVFFGRDPSLYSYSSHVAEGNPAAAMPSLHTGVTWLIALVAWNTRRWLRLPAVLYAGSMVLALVYLAEHYVADAALGIALASLAWWLTGGQARMAYSRWASRRPVTATLE